MDVYNLLKKMTLDEKIAEMSQLSAYYLNNNINTINTGPNVNMKVDLKQLANIGSVLNCFGAKEMISMQKKHIENHKNNIPLLFMLDVIHGYKTIYPIPLGMGATFNPKLLQKCCEMAAKEAAISGVHVTFSPMVDLTRDCRWGRVMESTGEDPYLNSIMAISQVKGYQGNNKSKYKIASCVKHFAAYGGCESGKDYNLVDMSLHTLYEYYLTSYKAAIDSGVSMVMTSFNTLNGIPVAGNKWLVNDVLRYQFSFDGVVITDYSSIYELINHGYCKDSKEATLKALEATNDIDMMSTCYLNNIKQLIKEKKINISSIDDSVLRILKLKDKLGLFDNPYLSASEKDERKYHLCLRHRKIVLKAAEESFVLLKNDCILPIGRNEKSIALIGPFSKIGMLGPWSCVGDIKDSVSVFDGLHNKYPNTAIKISLGCEDTYNASTNEKLLKEALGIAKESEKIILCLGENASMSGESASSSYISLPKVQKELIKEVYKVNQNIVLLLFTGRPLVLTDVLDYCKAIVVMWHPGTEGGNAIANLLCGEANFSGKLPMSFPKNVGQVPIYYNHLNTGRPKNNDNDHFVSGYFDCSNRPLFPFGYGLSYMKYNISNLKLSKNIIRKNGTCYASVTIENISEKSGFITIQLYIRDRYSNIVRPIKELKGVKKTFINAYEKKEVAFKINKKHLGYYGVNNEFVVEKGEFEIYISDSSETDKFVLLKYE